MRWQLPMSAVLTVLIAAGAAAGERSPTPVAVSPGGSQGMSRIADRCPTFSWAAVPGAQSYELVVYGVDGDEIGARTFLEQDLPGSAASWTPALDRCLERGRQYAWSVRAVGRQGPSEWSRASLFEVGEAEFFEALAVVERYLAGQPSDSEVAPVGETRGRTTRGRRLGATTGRPDVPMATGMPAIAAHGNSRCDGILPAAYATRLGNSSTDNDPDVLALQLTAQTDPATNMNYIGFFDWDSEQNKARLIGEFEGDGSGGVHFTGSASISGWMKLEGPERTCEAGSTCEDDLYCPFETGHRVLGGGFEWVGGASPGVHVIESWPDSFFGLTNWHVAINNEHSGEFRWRVVVICAKVGAL
jgi:hypothetical protein